VKIVPEYSSGTSRRRGIPGVIGAAETRQYNSMVQLTNLTINGSAIAYDFPSGTNNGKISSQVISGETVSYQYDSLNRLIAASSSAGWNQSYGYDGFGNLLSKTGSSGTPTLSIAVDPTTNRIVGQAYDSNGNLTAQEVYFYGVDGHKLGTYSMTAESPKVPNGSMSFNRFSTTA
jgi:YD repeat-containing protein